VHRVGQHEGKGLFEHMPDRLLIHARGFHRDVRAAVRREPLGQIEQSTSRRGQRAGART
jgi:hypothetical protein